MQQTTSYRTQSRSLLEQAFRELYAGDLRQAAEKGWDAAAHMVKAVAAERGWPHDDRRLLYDVLSRLVNELQDEELRDGFNAATFLLTLHKEDWLDREWVASSLGRVRTFVDAAEELICGR